MKWLLHLLLLLLATDYALAVTVRPPLPNIVILYTDDQGYGDLSCLNPESKFQTPNIDRLAKEGMTFTDGHSPDTVCTPSRYGLLTGRYAWRTHLKKGVFGAEGPCLIDDKRKTVAHLAKEKGYATAMVGKWHLRMDFPGKDHRDRDWSQPTVDQPIDKGFDYWFGIPASMNYGVLAWFEQRHAKVPPTLFTRKKPNKRAIKDYRITPPYDEAPKKKTGEAAPGGGRSSELEVAPDFDDVECLERFTVKALDWMATKAEGARNGTPFLLYVPYTSPHKPVIVQEKFRGTSEAGEYGDFMVETDHHVGRILDFLDQEKLAHNTLVFFSSDNGPENTWPARLEKFGHRSPGIYREGKRSIYEGGHRVPYLIRWPAVVKAGSVHDGPVCQTDLFATIAGILGTEVPADQGEDSYSMLGTLNGETVEQEPVLIHHASSGRFAVRHGKWKLVAPEKKKGWELYDLEADPSEKNEMHSNHPEVVEKLRGLLTEAVQDGRSTPGKAQANDGAAWWSDLTWIEKP